VKMKNLPFSFFLFTTILTSIPRGQEVSASTQSYSGHRDHSTTRLWDTKSLVEACDDIASTRICDPNHFLTTSSPNVPYYQQGDGTLSTDENEDLVRESDIAAITAALHDLETNHMLHCNNGTISTQVQMAVVVVQSMKLSPYRSNTLEYKTSEAKKITQSLHDTWGVGNTECGGSGVVLFLSIRDRVVYFSTSTGMNAILSESRIDAIIEMMKPYLRDGEYGRAIFHAILRISHYVDKGPASFSDDFFSYIMLGIGFVYLVGNEMWNKHSKKRYTRMKSQLTKLDHDKALALMGKYQCRSCPICLEDFQLGDTNDDNDKDEDDDDKRDGMDKGVNDIPKDSTTYTPPELGSDGRPIALLPCGHAFDQTCWEKWISAPTTSNANAHQCPICKHDIRIGHTSSKSTTTATATALPPRPFSDTQPRSDGWNQSTNLRNRSADPYRPLSPPPAHGLPLMPRQQDYETKTMNHQQNYGAEDSSECERQSLTSTPQTVSTTYQSRFPRVFSAPRTAYRSRFTTRRYQDTYQVERNFRLERLRSIYPSYIGQSDIDRWSRDDFDGTMAEDEHFVRREPDFDRSQSRSGSRNNGGGGSFGSFGGGSSGGGGGGGW
jgi:uncharacterized membrane protein YgcG